VTGFEFSLRNFSLGAQQTAGHFFGRHFQRKHTDGQTLIAADVQRDIQSKSGFTHGRTTGDDDELTRDAYRLSCGSRSGKPVLIPETLLGLSISESLHADDP